MFNIHSTEILLILIIALIVIGPEKLPATIKTASLWIGRFRRSFYKVKSEIERELNTDEIRRQLHNESVMAQIDETKTKVETIAKETETSVNKLVSTENFDPGASNATKESSLDEKSIGEEIKGTADEIQEGTKDIYTPSKNPKLSQKKSTKEAKQGDGVS